MTSRAYLTAAAIALVFSGAAFAQSSTGKSEATPSKSTTTTAADCASLTGDRKEQCMRQAQQGKSGSATGATPGGAGGGTSGSAPKAQSSPSGSAPSK
jgi:hypothetical protein